ncbi:CGNR zinc finger domain-containing protein [Actinoallomurus spadix]|uniref:CGNR zinc finger domain-containing protein n=1 Tax=Actinoallomurus spadix TaxID=79912 RepID=A0ABN0WQ41_9ACTN|nr:CGNR zinc finger domain-containing protein [Actinoallomurus spadix]MCO5984867.1 CGNR zinc finger domain-containing protein [Actinoallomurus spadix]
MGTSAPLLGEPLPIELMNTVWGDRDGVHDALDGPSGAEAWLRAVLPRIEPLTAADLDGLTADDAEDLARRLRALRDALRRLAAEATGDPRPAAAAPVRDLAAAVAVVNEAAGAAPRWSALTWAPGGTPARSVRAGGRAPAAAVSAVAEETVALFGRPDRLRLRACLAPGCVLYFLKDHPRREWCSTACGNRVRAARHYRRRRRPAS